MFARNHAGWISLTAAMTVLGLEALQTTPCDAQVSVLTHHNDKARTGAIQETVLSPANVNHAKFRRLFSHPVDGYVYSQPLYVPNVSIPGRGVRNVCYIATEGDSVYAFDADRGKGRNAKPLWKAELADVGAGITPVPSADTLCADIVPEIGITGTPAIDGLAGTLYVVAKTKDAGSGMYFQRLHALDIATGAEKFGGPVTITASVLGSGDGSGGGGQFGRIEFDPLKANQRSALLLDHGRVYIAWAAYCDVGPSHGWVMAYDAATLQQLAVFNTTPDGALGGVWQSGGGLAADSAGDVYLSTGNGTFDADGGGADYGDTVLKLAGGTLAVMDFFTPHDQAELSALDADLGSGGTVLLPDQTGPSPHLLATAGKAGEIYLIDRDDLGGYNPNDDHQIVQAIPHAFYQSFGSPAIWNDTLFYQARDDALRAFRLSGGQIAIPSSGSSGQGFSFPGSTPTISANGLTDAIAWVLQRDASTSPARTVLHAYDATDLSHELYNSLQRPRRDAIGDAVKFTVPTVANGKVYVGAQYRVSVFGLRRRAR